MNGVGALEQGHAAYAEQRWSEAYARLVAADRERPLGVDDLERLAVAAHVTGQLDARADAFARAYHGSLRAGDAKRAVAFAFWSAFGFADRGERARAEGWFLRAFELVKTVEVNGVERAYLNAALGFRAMESGDMKTVYDHFDQAHRIAAEFGDRSLGAMTGQALGRALIRMGRVPEGVVLLDEAMVAVTAGEVSPLVIGNVYCGVIEACKEVYDLRRAHEWTAALSRWCESQPDLVPYRGNCLVFRSELMRLHGAWPDAMEEASRAAEALRGEPALGAALYEQGEVHRLRGERARAEEAFRGASAAGHAPQPGLALLRLAQGEVAAARATLGRALEETRDPVIRCRLLPALVEVALAAGEVAAGRAAADELEAFASRIPSAYLRAIAAHARAQVLLAEKDAMAAVPMLREAWSGYRDVEAPYESARIRELLGVAFQELGDEPSAEMELDAARTVFEELDARADAARVRGRSQARPAGASGLTARELEVLALVAKGRTNRQVADELVISEKTVARHLSNIFDKLDVASRAALTAYAYEHGLIQH
ncbi:MAG TPA: LuxR C-terminal-related transcriptional regulator [Candidatus Limnocylindria bacterium]|jgi:DNA-binding CsgD family transcriptional regulator